MRDIGKRGLLFLDDGTSAQSKTAVVAKGTEVPYAFADCAAGQPGRCERHPAETRRT